ncbi:hypothetical protein BCR34DRAFT_43875 [Clohesyomyces aquaticus]|uniref:Uncharacterized protein n=1 Tax=Clohesyomyces aquaticus TaxID=1231657 RepID=A0A1Y1Z7D1_9PLEO|nr:hypothetical protein BCR34DRAFT_43875 [Clohesyomyces aquaticus]
MTPNSPIEQWTIIMSQSETTPAPNPAQAPAASEPKVELTINTKPAPEDAPSTEKKECTCDARPSLSREETVETIEEIISEHPRGGRARRRHRDPPARVYSRSRSPLVWNPPTTPINASTQLLDVAKDFDGVIELPFPARSNAYMVTFPFTNTDVQKWTWLFKKGILDVFMKKGGNNDDEDEDEYDEWGNLLPPPPVRRGRRNRSPYYNGDQDMPSIFLSRAIDTEVVPEDAKNVVYWIVVQQVRGKAKLMVAESRKAAGILIYYEALNGNSISFVGAVAVGEENKKYRAKKFKKVDKLEEAGAEEQETSDGVHHSRISLFFMPEIPGADCHIIHELRLEQGTWFLFSQGSKHTAAIVLVTSRYMYVLSL